MEIQQVPPLESGRPETGPMQFGDDWPGVFIRGDNAFHFAMTLDLVLKNFGDQMHPLMERAVLEGLMKTLQKSRVVFDT